MPRGRWKLSLLLVMPLAGCAAGGRVPGIRPDIVSAKTAPRTSPLAADLANNVNRNARAVQALTASTTVSTNGSRFAGGVSGQMALERPRNFKMELERGGLGSNKVVDVGSNSDEFWFWMKDSEQKAIYVGQYDSQGETPNEFLFHPDWIVEALGLRPITPAEVAQAKLARGREPGTLVMTQSRPDAHGGSRVKQTVFDENTRRIRQHVFFASDGKTRIAEVFPSEFRRLPLPGQSTASSTATVELPTRIKLRLTPATRDPKDQVEMEIALRDVRLNPKLDEVNREALFRVPSYPGYQVVELTPPKSAVTDAGTRQYEPDLPSRRASHDVMLEAPVPMSNERAWMHQGDPLPLSDDLPQARANAPRGERGLIRPGIPEPPVAR